MSTRKCRDCGHPCSTRAKTCPNCGAHMPTKPAAQAALDDIGNKAATAGCAVIVLIAAVVAVIAIFAALWPT